MMLPQYIASVTLLIGALAAPSMVQPQRRQVSYTCAIQGWYEMDNSIVIAPGEPGSISNNNLNTGINITMFGSDGSARNIYNGDDNSLNMNGLTIPTSETSMAADFHYYGTWEVSWLGCGCDYNGAVNNSGVIGDDSYVSPFYQQDTSDCVCSVPCSPPTVATGWCGAHITQYQKPDPATDSYSYDVQLKDANGIEIGSVSGVSIPTGQRYDMTSELPYTFAITSGAIDDDPVQFAYADQFWDSSSAQCSVGAYDSGDRDMDCGFTC